jgi:hypothetical protein
MAQEACWLGVSDGFTQNPSVRHRVHSSYRLDIADLTARHLDSTKSIY